jgi:5S rRNA maturation endonuclease (ribonuclease M5)
MARKSYPGAFAVVEGTDDARLYSDFVDSNHCVFKVAHSKDRAIETVAKFSDSWGVLAIVDAEEWSLIGKSVPISHVFFTDTHDAETMIIKSNAFEKYLRHRTTEIIHAWLKKRKKEINCC